MKTLYLCEKPSQARDIARVLQATQKNEGYLSNSELAVTWCFGHLLETAEPDTYCDNLKPWRREVLPIIPEVWKMVVKKACQKQFNVIKKLLNSAKTVVIATDADREGEVIAREVLEYCNYQGNIERLWLSALDDASIKAALKQLRDGSTTELLYAAGLGRQRADWLVGMNLTMAATCQYSAGQGVLSVGRVQTPTLRLIVERNESIANFVPVEYYELLAQFKTTTNDASSFWAKWLPHEDVLDLQQHCVSKAVVDEAAQKILGQKAEVTQFEESVKTKAPPLGLSLSTLQKLASSRFGFSVKETLDIAQALYETHKATTYPRTDSGYLPTSQFQDAPKILQGLKGINEKWIPRVARCDLSYQSPIWNDKKITAHHAIIPTSNTDVAINNMSDKEFKIYELISEYYIAQFLGDYVYCFRSATIQVAGEQFKATSHQALKAGWKGLLNSLDESDDSEDSTTLPFLTSNQVLTVSDQKLVTKHTEPHAQYTEGTLVESMKSIGKMVTDQTFKKILKDSAGIGTEATRANIIETLLKRDFVTKKGKQLYATDKGKSLIAKLPKTVSDPLLTAQLEQALDAVAKGELSLTAFMSEQTTVIHDMLQALDSNRVVIPSSEQYQCPYCHKSLMKRFSPKTKAHFWGCSGYPICRTTFLDKEGKPCFDPTKKCKIS